MMRVTTRLATTPLSALRSIVSVDRLATLRESAAGAIPLVSPLRRLFTTASGLVACAASVPELPLLFLVVPVPDPPSVRVPVLRGAGPGSVVPDGCVPSPVVGAPLLLGVSPEDAGGSSTPPPATGPLGPVDPVAPVGSVAPVSPVGSSAGSSTEGPLPSPSMIVDCGDEAFVLDEDLLELEDLLDEDLFDEDLEEDDDELEDSAAAEGLDSAAGAAGSGAGVDSGTGAGSDSAGVETAAAEPDPADPVSSPDANAGTVAGITSNMQKIRIVAIFDR
jgi:hypothetical protein